MSYFVVGINRRIQFGCDRARPGALCVFVPGRGIFGTFTFRGSRWAAACAGPWGIRAARRWGPLSLICVGTPSVPNGSQDQSAAQIGSLMREDMESVISGQDFLVAGRSDHRIFEALARHVREDQVVLDLVNIPKPEALRGKWWSCAGKNN